MACENIHSCSTYKRRAINIESTYTQPQLRIEVHLGCCFTLQVHERHWRHLELPHTAVNVKLEIRRHQKSKTGVPVARKIGHVYVSVKILKKKLEIIVQIFRNMIKLNAINV